MDTLTYYEVKRWFWIRTWMWSIPVFILSILLFYFYSRSYFEDFEPLFKVSLAGGLITPLLSIFSAFLSVQLPWMRLGWLVSFVINGPFCIIVGGLVSAFLSGIFYSFISTDIDRPLEVLEITKQILKLVVLNSAFWGFVYGTWFAMRKDKYFVEPI
ncbi:MAG: hypothetical protein SNJ70_10740 [Armatimonadota bacterium]